MKTIIIILISIVSFSFCHAQAPQFAVVRPNGTTYICPTWDSAYNKAVNDDYIYLPGITINTNSIILDKKIHIYGAGHHPDSTLATGRTIFSGNIIYINSGASGGSIEGINHNQMIILGAGNGRKITNYLIKCCRFERIDIGGGTMPIDSLPSNIVLTENVFSDLYGYGASNNSFQKNLIRNYFTNIRNSELRNNVFLGLSGASYNPLSSITNCSFYNTIFIAQAPFTSSGACSNYFYNTLRLVSSNLSCPPQNYTELGTITVSSVSDIFLNFNTSYAGFPYLDDYRLKPTCPGVNGGTDGTDVGIFGTNQPTPIGWVPSNPHIYFKQVATQTNSSGQLQIQFRVRTNN